MSDEEWQFWQTEIWNNAVEACCLELTDKANKIGVLRSLKATYGSEALRVVSLEIMAKLRKP